MDTKIEDFETDYIVYSDEDKKIFTLIVDSPIFLTNSDYIRELEYFVKQLKELGDELELYPKVESPFLN